MGRILDYYSESRDFSLNASIIGFSKKYAKSMIIPIKNHIKSIINYRPNNLTFIFKLNLFLLVTGYILHMDYYMEYL